MHIHPYHNSECDLGKKTSSGIPTVQHDLWLVGHDPVGFHPAYVITCRVVEKRESGHSQTANCLPQRHDLGTHCVSPELSLLRQKTDQLLLCEFAGDARETRGACKLRYRQWANERWVIETVAELGFTMTISHGRPAPAWNSQ